MSYFVFIITSRNNPEYEIFDSIRRKQMNELGVQYRFLLNGILPEGYTLQDDELYFTDSSFTPGMFIKFYQACKNMLMLEHGLPDYIIRLNSSTFVDFLKIPGLLNRLPTSKCIGGLHLQYQHDPSKFFISGTAMIFSKDVIEYLVTTIDINSSIGPDDFALSDILIPFCGNSINLSSFFLLLSNECIDLSRRNEDTIFYRILNKNRLITDVLLWNTLYEVLYI